MRQIGGKMGINTKIFLPHSARLRDVSNVIGMLVGCPHTSNRFLVVDGVEIKGNPTMPECPIISIKPEHFSKDVFKARDGDPIYWLFHYETESDARLIAPGSNKFSIALGKRLVDFFGGWVDFNDCDSLHRDHEAPIPAFGVNSAEDGKPFWDLQKRMASVKPLTLKEINSVKH
jgi:hypothetical protein